MRLRSSDYSCIPLCPEHHRSGNESYHHLSKAEFEQRHNLNCTQLSNKMHELWMKRSEQPA
jgi:hypothetical protein